MAERFWQTEFNKTLNLILDSNTPKEIKEKQEKENFLLAKTEGYSKRIVNTVLRRISRIPNNIVNNFNSFDSENQKIINLISIMQDDRLFFEFVYEVYRPSIIDEDYLLTKPKENAFINSKSIESERFNNFKDVTKKRLISSYRNYLLEAGVIVKKDGEYQMRRLFLDERLLGLLKDNQYDFILKALVEDIHE